MAVFIMPRDITSGTDAGDIKKDIENTDTFNEKVEIDNEWCEGKTFVFNEKTRKKRTEQPVIIIHQDIKKKDGKKLSLNDIEDSTGFGNGCTVTQLTIKTGEKVPCCFVVFPHARKTAIEAKLTKLKSICTKNRPIKDFN